MKYRGAVFAFGMALVALPSLAEIEISAQTPQTPQIFQGPAIEEFLTRAKFISLKDIGQGVTLPEKAALELDGVTQYGVFKTIDEYAKLKQLDRGVEVEFQDSWKTEVAAYE